MDSSTAERRGEEAARIINNELYKKSWDDTRERIIAVLEQPNLSADERERLNHVLVGLKTARRYLEQVMVTGTMVAMEAQRKRSIADRMLRRA